MSSTAPQPNLPVRLLGDTGDLLRTIGEAAPDFLWVADPLGEVIYVNRRWCEYTGMSPDQWANKGFLRPVHPEDVGPLRAVIERAVREGAEFEAEFRYRRHDGAYRWFWTHSVPLRDESGNVVRRVGLSRDVEDRRRAETALRHSRDVLDTVFELAAVGLTLTDEDGRFVRVNRAFAQTCGYAPEELVGRDALSLLPPEEREETLRRRRMVAAGERPPPRDVPVITKDGRRRVLHTAASTFIESDGRRLLIGVADDVTEQRQVETALLEAGRRLHSVLDSIAEGYVVLDADFRFVEINPAAQRMAFAGRPVAELVGKSFWDEYPRGGGADEFYEQFRRAVGDRIAVHFEAKGGASGRWLETHAYPRDDGRLEVYFRDITDRKAAEEALAASEREFRAIFELSNSGKGQADPQTGRFLRVNRKLCEITGYSREELLERTFYDVTHPDDVGRDRERMARLLGGAVHEWQTEKRYVRKDGQVVWVSVAGSVIRDGAGAALRLIATVQDVTARRLAEEAAHVARAQAEAAKAAAEAAKAAAEAANSAKDRFLAVLSHELRTPLTPVVMTLAGLEMDRSLSQDVRDDLAMIRRNVELETKLIDDLLDVTRIAHGKLRLHPQPADAHPLIESVIDLFHSDVRVKRLSLRREWQAGDARVSGDPARLQQVFWNLVKNAIKFTPEGGNILVRTRNPHPRTLAVDVSDDGVGIEPSALPRLFTAFEQAEQTVTRQFGGLGLGLAISKALVELHGGSVHVYSAGRGRGATFTVELPTIGTVEEMVSRIRPGAAPAAGEGDLGLGSGADAGAGAEAGAGGGAGRLATQPHVRVLLVEDHEDTLRILKRLLEKMGYAVFAASSAAGAMEALAAQSVDVIVSDIGLPDATGHDLMRRVRATPAHGRLPAIAISGFGTDADVRNSHSAGFHAHMTKPVDVRQLDAAIRTAVRHATPTGM